MRRKSPLGVDLKRAGFGLEECKSGRASGYLRAEWWASAGGLGDAGETDARTDSRKALSAAQLSMQHSRPFASVASNPRNGIHIHIHMPPAAAKPRVVPVWRRSLVPGPVDTVRALLDVTSAAEKR